jgi:hypothetical protein
VFGAGDRIDYGGVAFVRQDDPYRCSLPDVGGSVISRTRIEGHSGLKDRHQRHVVRRESA